MITNQQLKQIRELIAIPNLSNRAIAKRSGVSPTTVSNIRKRKGAYKSLGGEGKKIPIIPAPNTNELGTCKTCGSMVYLPCVACNVRQVVRRKCSAE